MIINNGTTEDVEKINQQSFYYSFNDNNTGNIFSVNLMKNIPFHDCSGCLSIENGYVLNTITNGDELISLHEFIKYLVINKGKKIRDDLIILNTGNYEYSFYPEKKYIIISGLKNTYNEIIVIN